MFNYKNLIKYFSDLSIHFFYIIITFFLTFIICYIKSDALIYIIIKPFLIKMYAHRFIFTGLLEIFFIYFKFSFFFTNLLIFPIILIHI